jgi:hypothetical protein
MIVKEIEKNSEGWLEDRKGKSGGSEFGNLYTKGLPNKTRMIEFIESSGNTMTPADKRSKVEEIAAMLTPAERAMIKLEGDRKRKYYEMIAEDVSRPITPNDYLDRLNGQPYSAMARGHLLEEDAAKAYEKHTGVKLDKKDVIWVREDNEKIYISPDRTITTRGKCKKALEIKCPDNWKVIKMFLEGDWDREEYEAQVMKYFIVNEDLEELDLVIYTDNIPGLELQIFTIKRSDYDAGELEEAKIFEDEIMKQKDIDSERISALAF